MEGLHGGNFDDTFTGDAGSNTLFGLNGNDVLNGGDGNDFLYGGAGNDVIDGGGGQDAVGFYGATGPITASLVTGTSSGQGADTLISIEDLLGSDYNDTLTGDDGNDTLSGGDGNDFLAGGAGDDAMTGGGQPFDAVAFFDARGPVTASLVTGKASGDGDDTFSGVAQLYGGDYSDTLIGDGADNVLIGFGGNDTLNGGDGNDSITGGPGDDTIDGGAGTFDFVGFWDATGGVIASLTTGTSSGGGEGDDVFTNIEVLSGSPYADHLTGGTTGEGGVTGQGGNDTIFGGSGGGFLLGDDGDDTLIGGAANDYLVGGPGDDAIDGGAGWDTSSYINAPGPVTASLDSGSATGDGYDSLTGIEQLDGSPFGDTFTGDADNNGFNTFGGDDTVMAGSGDDWASGGAGNDSLYGEAGNDYLDGGDDFDFADGGPDWDTCVNVENAINCEG
jgi:Ca2+-binding RTX toxin-like protein